ncbi:hypothetical protein [Verrucosispora sioxanthis]|uniref:Uncharacterized protein n=1 Tax=Verrucosispora sioxanthis TaxID=2499994 RepID=A0A6M1LAD7_9ACTN|nr:hypothetical protein [Verrucosispora sioxanthis]NEE66142.1 hypothetical protein [Verrucosispora sioxanthis]NGM15252.1 hypothetical protein [Verrucosispora sioxanthis]
MSGVADGWRAHPEAVDARPGLPPVAPGRVVGVGAICDLRPRRPDDAGSQSFSVAEFVRLEDSRRVILHEDRGFTIGRTAAGPPSGAAPVHLTRDEITRNVMNVVLTDDGTATEEHPWSWLADLARARGLNVTAAGLRRLPYEVVLTEQVTRWLGPT